MPTSTFLGMFSGAVLTESSGPPPSGSTGYAGPGERLYDGHEGGGETQTFRQYARMEVWCGYADLHTLIEQIVGPVEVYPSIWGGSIGRRLPMAHPDVPGLYATRYSYTGQGRPSASRLYQHYRVRIEFENLPYEAAGDTPFMSVAREFGLRVVTIPGRAITLSTGQSIEQDVGLPIPTINLLVTVYGSPSPPFDLLFNATSAPINSVPLYLPGMPPIPAGHAMFNGEAEQTDLSYGGNVSKVVGYRFSVQGRLRWDQIISQYTGGLVYPLTPDGNRVVASSDLNILFNY